CGDVAFVVEGATTQSPTMASFGIDRAAQTLPSPFAVDPSSRPAAGRQATTVEDEHRYKDKLFLLIRASEMCVSEMSIDRILDELIALAVQVLEVDRITLLTLDDASLELEPRVQRTFVGAAQPLYSARVVNWVIDHGSPASFADVSRDRS